MRERLQKIIAAAGLMARRKAEEAIRAGRVTVNGVPASLGESADPETDEICLDGKPLPKEETKRTVLLYKPRGVVTSLRDEKGRRDLRELLRDFPERLTPVGRLDLDSEGLLLLTNDGDLEYLLTHPSHEVEKCYLTWVKGENIETAVRRLGDPMEIDGYAIRPAKAELLEKLPGGAKIAVTIHEGRNRQVRKMCEIASLTVTRLCRVREGFLRLGALRPGEWRDLTAEEVERLRKEAAR